MAVTANSERIAEAARRIEEAAPGAAKHSQDKGEQQRILADVQDAAGDLAHFVWPEFVPASRALPSAAADVTERPTQRVNRTLPRDQTLRQGSGAIFVAEVLSQLQGVDGFEIEHQGDVREYRAALNPTIQVRTVETGDWFDLQVTVEIEGEQMEFAALFTALSLGDDAFVLPSGKYFPLVRPDFDRLRAILTEARALVDAGATTFDERIRVNRHNVDLWTELADLSIVTTQTSEWWQAIRQLADGTEDPDDGSGELGGLPRVDAPTGLRATLRDYQRDGLAWLHFLRTHRLGGILADDMGLGKTLQVIAMMEIAREENPEQAPFLVVAPTSVVSNWASECAKFAPGLKVSVISAMAGRRGKPLADSVRSAHVVLSSYALLRGEAEEYRALDWSGLVLDEAQQIKNPASHGHRAARMLGAPFTLVVTGTPLENNLLKLWSLTSLAAPGLLGNKARFTEFYRTPIEKEQDAEKLALLQRRLRPFLLRRTKDLVAADLPPKQEQVLEISLHPKHRKLYDVRFQRERQKILGLVGDVAGNRFQIFKSLTMLRQLALDPELVGAGSAPSAKLDALIELLTEAAEEGHRVLVLSHFTLFLGAARDRAEPAGLVSNYLDGSTTNRCEVIDDFRNGTAPVFFVSLKAGGFGLNLVEADYVVLLDPWWNPAATGPAPAFSPPTTSATCSLTDALPWLKSAWDNY
ncbi:DEAD/DEAH box helicase [Gulosibacter chungangensis]|uniref:DEAD/DEAH box helicase n=1 Tax=Gulosibacter chungangensis TaxID=979746 RepID=UPI001CE3E61F|nr:DEAD/DEAH box helicase [Gulosibacter chungangensis]